MRRRVKGSRVQGGWGCARVRLAVLASLLLSAVPARGDAAMPIHLESGDFNRDGLADLVALWKLSAKVSLYLSNGDGTFSAEALLAAGTGPRSLAIADLDRDGNTDVLVGNYDSKDVSVLGGRGDGTFKPPSTLPLAASPLSLTSGDFDKDGKPDLAAITATDLWSFAGKGDGTFAAGVKQAGTAKQARILTADVNGDGKVDLLAAPAIVYNARPNPFLVGGVYLGNGDGTFQAAVAGPFDESVSVADLDRDGADDLITCLYRPANVDPSSVEVRISKRDGTFQPAKTWFSMQASGYTTTADLDHDGKLDVVVSNLTGELAVFLGNGDGTLQDARFYGIDIGNTIGRIIPLDVDGNGYTDLATLRYYSAATDALRVVRNAGRW